jgi:hypothetical protein
MLPFGNHWRIPMVLVQRLNPLISREFEEA